MEKKFYVLLLIIITNASCHKECINTSCIMLSQNPEWTLSPFKSNYTIQFSTGYVGDGMGGFEGNIFYKNRSDNSVIFRYAYCSPLFCNDFGEALDQPQSPSINIVVNNSIITLNQKVTFCDNGSQIGILFYKNNNNAYGRLYWKDNGIYKEALDISYNYSRHQEVLNIIRTIKRK